MPWIERDGEWELERLLLSGVNPAIPVYGDKPGSKLDWLIDDWYEFDSIIFWNDFGAICYQTDT